MIAQPCKGGYDNYDSPGPRLLTTDGRASAASVLIQDKGPCVMERHCLVPRFLVNPPGVSTPIDMASFDDDSYPGGMKFSPLTQAATKRLRINSRCVSLTRVGGVISVRSDVQLVPGPSCKDFPQLRDGYVCWARVVR